MADTSYKKLLAVNETRAGRELVSSSLELLRLSNTTSYELDDLSAQVPDVKPKWTTKPRAISAALGHRLASWTQQTLRNFRLLLLMAFGPWKKKEEEPKIALYTGWVFVMTGLLVHVLPLAACITLIYLNFSSYFMGTHVSTLAFQFLAKFLELLAQASLGSAVFVDLRALHTGPESVPFGTLFAGLQITKVSYLWSLEFAGVVTSTNFGRSRKLVFLLLIPLSILLAVGIGPSFAIALTPTLGDFYAGWTEAWINATDEQIFPSNIRSSELVYNFSSDCSTGDCAWYGWETAITIAQSSEQLRLQMDALPYNSPLNGSFSLTQDALPHREIQWSTTVFGPDSVSATVTIPSKVIAWSLNQLAQQSYFVMFWAFNQDFTTITRQPVVTVNCATAHWLNSTSIYGTFEAFENQTLGIFQYILQFRSIQKLLNLNQSEYFDWAFIDLDNLIIQGPPQLIPSAFALSYDPLADPKKGGLGLCAIYAGYAHVQNKVSFTDETIGMSNSLIKSNK